MRIDHLVFNDLIGIFERRFNSAKLIFFKFQDE